MSKETAPLLMETFSCTVEHILKIIILINYWDGKNRDLSSDKVIFKGGAKSGEIPTISI